MTRGFGVERRRFELPASTVREAWDRCRGLPSWIAIPLLSWAFASRGFGRLLLVAAGAESFVSKSVSNGTGADRLALRSRTQPLARASHPYQASPAALWLLFGRRAGTQRVPDPVTRSSVTKVVQPSPRAEDHEPGQHSDKHNRSDDQDDKSHKQLQPAHPPRIPPLKAVITWRWVCQEMWRCRRAFRPGRSTCPASPVHLPTRRLGVKRRPPGGKWARCSPLLFSSLANSIARPPV